MSIPFSIDLKKDSNTNELIFLDTVEDLLGERYKIYKTTDRYASVDFIVNRDDNLLCYIELKVRENISNFDTLMIGTSKLKSIKLKYPKCFFVWFCCKTSTLWYIKFSNEIMRCGHNAETYFINKDLCLSGLDNFVETITNF